MLLYIAVADTFVEKAEFLILLKIMAIYSLNGCYVIQRLSEMGEWFAPTLLSCLFSVKPHADQAAYLFQA